MLRPYQAEQADIGADLVTRLGIAYLAMEMRVGKSHIAMAICERIGAKNVLFVTKKKAIGSIEGDYEAGLYSFGIKVTNRESLHKISKTEAATYDAFIVDESHGIGGYPKPSLGAQQLQAMVGKSPLLLLSGTPTPETASQIYHQFWISGRTPFVEPSFYKWANNFVNVRMVERNGYQIREYKDALWHKIQPIIAPYMLSYTREEAGFKQSEVQERIVYIDSPDSLTAMIKKLIRDRVYYHLDTRIVADSAVKLQNKVHQMSSGTVITEDGAVVIDNTKATYIRDNYKTKKIAVFYKYKAEAEALKAVLSNWTESVDDFAERADKIFISQLQSGSEGINLASADILIFYNIDFSAKQYLQARARLQALERESVPEVHWLFLRGGIEDKIYTAVTNKLDYTLRYFAKDFLRN